MEDEEPNLNTGTPWGEDEIRDLPHDRALELGCGTGFFLLNLIQAGVARRGSVTDLSPGMVKVATRNGESLGLDIRARGMAGRADLPPLSYVLHSSPKRVHVFWRVTGFTIEQVEALQQQLASELDTDPAAAILQMAPLKALMGR